VRRARERVHEGDDIRLRLPEASKCPARLDDEERRQDELVVATERTLDACLGRYVRRLTRTSGSNCNACVEHIPNVIANEDDLPRVSFR
jgi:hypothetical protein